MGNCSFLFGLRKNQDSIREQNNKISLNLQNFEEEITSSKSKNINQNNQIENIEINTKTKNKETYSSKFASIFNNEPLDLDANKMVFETIGLNYRKTLPSITLSNNAVYIGEWMNGKKDGIGKLIWPDNSTYYGNWVKDNATGEGQIYNN